MRSFNLIQIFTTLQVDRYQLISFHRPNVEELEPFCVPRPCGTAAVFFSTGQSKEADLLIQFCGSSQSLYVHLHVTY